jgi:hypothetical protein
VKAVSQHICKAIVQELLLQTASSCVLQPVVTKALVQGLSFYL